jgi:hypothetical protein
MAPLIASLEAQIVWFHSVTMTLMGTVKKPMRSTFAYFLLEYFVTEHNYTCCTCQGDVVLSSEFGRRKIP